MQPSNGKPSEQGGAQTDLWETTEFQGLGLCQNSGALLGVPAQCRAVLGYGSLFPLTHHIILPPNFFPCSKVVLFFCEV